MSGQDRGQPGGGGGGSTDPMTGLPALFVQRPYFPGEVLDFDVTWDFEDAAIQAADGGPGILALVPASTDLDTLAVDAEGGGLIATLGRIIARSRQGVVRVRSELRFRVTALARGGLWG